MKAAACDDAEHVWEMLVTLVMDTRGDWRRKVSEVSGLPFSRVRALRRLRQEPRTLGELAYDMGTDAPAATVIVNDLERRGLVQRCPHPQDRRIKLVSLTAEGQDKLLAVQKISDHPPAAFANLPATQLRLLRQHLALATREHADKP